MKMWYCKILAYVALKAKLILLASVFLIIVCGIVYSILLGQKLDFLDERDYFSIANNIVSQGVFSVNSVNPTAYRPPFYPAVLAVFIELGSGIVVLRIVNFVCLGLSVVMAFSLLRRLDPTDAAGAIAAVLFIGYPVLFYTAGTLYPQTLAAFLLLSVLYLCSRAESGGFALPLACGLVLGIAILTVPTFIFVLIVCAGWAAFMFKEPAIRSGAIILVAALSIVALWSVRNYVVFGQPVFVSTNSGVNLLLGNSKNTTANSGVDVDLQDYRPPNGLNEVEVDRYYRNEAIKFILSDPYRWLKLYTKKVANYFNYEVAQVSQVRTVSFQNLIMGVTYGFLLITFIVRALFMRRYPMSRLEALLVVIYFVNALFSALFFTRIRFRLPFDTILIVLDSLFLSRICAEGVLNVRRALPGK
jgi:Dolichyl-phosphate-mannose-protein mannosyltransferase